MRVQLTRKLAEMIDGIDLRHCEVGDVIELSERDARLLIAEGWGVLVDADVTCVARRRATTPRTVRRAGHENAARDR